MDAALYTDLDAWLVQLSRTCRAKDKPCGGCQQGAMCDGILGGGRFEDDDDDEEYDGEACGNCGRVDCDGDCE